MRGAPRINRVRGSQTGIIPADAGSTSDTNQGSYHAEDHPRGCGEHVGKTLFNHRVAGSSPRMRGAQIFGSENRLKARIIPADAGST